MRIALLIVLSLVLAGCSFVVGNVPANLQALADQTIPLNSFTGGGADCSEQTAVFNNFTRCPFSTRLLQRFRQLDGNYLELCPQGLRTAVPGCNSDGPNGPVLRWQETGGSHRTVLNGPANNQVAVELTGGALGTGMYFVLWINGAGGRVLVDDITCGKSPATSTLPTTSVYAGGAAAIYPPACAGDVARPTSHAGAAPLITPMPTGIAIPSAPPAPSAPVISVPDACVDLPLSEVATALNRPVSSMVYAPSLPDASGGQKPCDVNPASGSGGFIVGLQFYPASAIDGWCVDDADKVIEYPSLGDRACILNDLELFVRKGRVGFQMQIGEGVLGQAAAETALTTMGAYVLNETGRAV